MSTQIPLHPRPLQQPTSSTSPLTPNPLPTLIQTPSGLALLELQGTLNIRDFDPSTITPTQTTTPVAVGRIDFPDHQPHSLTFDPNDKKWMKRVYMYIGEHQRLHGEVKALPKPVGVARKRHSDDEEKEELEVVDIIRYKMVFASRPEPVTRAEQFAGRE
ncbi:Ctf8-domain-containing protein [Pseudoneurospora amorphoporcata]|uniref:Ctf8-domain-containing protein n=1 Tax=Pseudoneurospora amorphoporcata TaxID=241081 RepID=A0AAN6NKZ3_9PEZI|nr:Ctf8-domain-containing protein [Pseudoneurospora amorphoporcata]